MRALDLCCCAGGATRGLQMAGYHVTGVDIRPQPHYCGDVFIQASALDVDLAGYDLIWASPPCQLFSELTPFAYRENHTDLIGPMRERLMRQFSPWIIENVAGAVDQLRSPVMLCGSMFGLDIWRHRYFEIGNTAMFFLTQSCDHSFVPVLVSGRGNRKVNGRRRGEDPKARRAAAMHIDWMSYDELSQAIPPAYSKFLAEQIQEHVHA